MLKNSACTAARKFFSVFKFVIASALLVTGVVSGLAYGWLFFQYQKIVVSVTNIEIEANSGNLAIGFTLSGSNPLPFVLNLKKYEGKVSHGALSRDFAVSFKPALVITQGNYQLRQLDVPLVPGYPVGTEQVFITLLRGKNLQVKGEATISIGKIEKSVPVSLNLSIEN